ncbi:Lpt [Drosophila busckii]|uniref:Lpt n=1 Tax=Drosophila busckii TaxID=30019 RepID=A0A0M4EBI1_DROBS|nr:Lpt [Drosophila busckii]
MEEKQVIDELPYFPEKYPGKACCLCNLGERSALGQGTMLQLKVPTNFIEQHPTFPTVSTDKELELYRKLSTATRSKTGNVENTYELNRIGFAEMLNAAVFIDDGFVYVHQMCIMWSLRKVQVTDLEVAQLLSNLPEFLEQKCSFCGQHGASVTCKMNCRQVHHWPCAAAASCLLILESFTLFCTEHLSQVPLICTDNNVECLSCSSLGDLSKIVMCCSCGDHFHTTCIGLANLPDTRSGWNCSRCTKCQICRQSDTMDIKFVKCEQCQKIYHATCLRPIISSVPKYGWKCNRCRVCTDCGSRTPGGGSSSRWHSHYTICDSCYQQRNKGFSCPICQKAYRAAAYKEMVKCSWCHKFVHSTCDEEADLTAYHRKKEYNPDYDYVCPNCKCNPTNATFKTEPLERSISETQATEQFKDVDLVPLDNKCLVEVGGSEDPLKLPGTKRKVCISNMRGKGGKFVLQRMGAMSSQLVGKKRSSRGKGRQLVLQGGTSNERYISRNLDTDFSSDKKMLLCSERDKFIITQDVCVMCGSVGIESDSALITCAQCGQCYHTYCASVKPSRSILQKGWRCLDCTVCEGCGKKNDEARLLLCDECDISYHIYCVNPPLETVPHGNWKCSFCTICQKCGHNPSEKGDNADPECPPCASQTACVICKKSYREGEMIIQCESCAFWSHFLCDSQNTQLKFEYYANNFYKCLKCRKGTKMTALQLNCTEDVIATTKYSSDLSQEPKNGNSLALGNELLESSEAIHWIDGVCLSESGLNMIKSLSTEIKRKRKMRQTLIHANKDGQMDANLADESPGEVFKDGMIWEKTDTSLPEGFSISTNDDGVHILRKKRQRNLQKLGIGGFSVRNRALKKDNDETVDQLNAMLTVDKKKKMMRKKQKNRLIEAYPAYLQEAFFGKPLLESGDVAVYESESSDEIDTSMKAFFTQANGTKHVEEHTRSPFKSMKKTKAEKPMPETMNVFVEQSVAMRQKNNPVFAGDDTMFDASVTEIANNTSTQVQTMDSLVPQGIPEIDLAASTVNFIPQKDIKPNVCEQSTTALVDNYSVSPQLKPEQKLHTQLPMRGMPPQFYQQTKVPNMTTQLPQQIEEIKPAEPVLEGITAGPQKTAEKMRKDEELGLMATISAVLYANTEHANLKELYPNWNDRCKQILKKWRSLCNEKKAPFLQKAKDNRSALRQRREQCKISQPTKLNQLPVKQDDSSVRAWKHHPCNPKEEQTQLFGNYNGIAYDNCYMGTNIQNINSLHAAAGAAAPMLTESIAVKSAVQRTTGQNSTTVSSAVSLKMSSSLEQRLESSATYGSETVGDKKLRNLLQKSMMQSSQNNPMLSMSGNPQHTEVRGIDNDKHQIDIKMTESQEAISSTAVELENVGFGDILGGFGEGDDDDLLKSLTSEIGDDFNILEYADPELDVNVLNTLDFEDNEKSSA